MLKKSGKMKKSSKPKGVKPAKMPKSPFAKPKGKM